MGLLLPHICKCLLYPDVFTVSAGGDRVQVGGGKRGRVKIFSKESRFRLFRLLHTLTYKKVSFVTLTYPEDFPTDAKIYKGHLREFRRRFELRFAKVQTVWRLEFQARGAPHYHLMFFDLPFVPIVDLCYLWSDVIHTYDMAHRRNGVDIKLIKKTRDKKLIASYLSKYIAKVNEDDQKTCPENCGRWWGCWNIEEQEPYEIELYDFEAALLVDRVLATRQSGNWKPLDNTRCSVLGETMGTDLFRQEVIKKIKAIRNVT